MNKVEFSRPVKVGRIVKIYGEVLKMGTTSLSIKLKARSYNPHSGRMKSVCSTEMVFVRIDDDGEPLKIVLDNS